MGKISNYTRALVAKLQDVFVVDQTDNNVTTTKSVTVEQIGDTIAGTQVHSDLKTDSQTIIGGINELAKDKNVADEYDDTHTYNIGDITIYGNTLYICQNNSVTGAFDPSKWTATTIDNVIGSLSTLTTSVTSSLVGAVNEVNLKTKEIYNNTTYSNQIGTNVFTNTNMGDFRFLRITIGVSSFDSWNMTYILIPNCKAATTGYYQFASNNVGGKLIRISTNTSTTISIISSSEASICVSQVVGIY